MGLFSKWRIHRSVADEDIVDISEQDGVRALHLGSDTIQSAMRLSAPNDLELSYTRAMMGFLLFHPDPREVLMVGLGGGSLAKFVYHRLPGAVSTVVEINPRVVAAARHFFFVPPDDERLHVRLIDAAEYVVEHRSRFDVILADGFGIDAPIDALTTQDFYEACHAALTPDGVLVVNLWGSDRRFDTFLKRIEAAFEGLTVLLPAEKKGNIIVLAFRKSPGQPRWEDLRHRAKELESAYGLEFPRFVDQLKKMNLHSEKRLLV